MPTRQAKSRMKRLLKILVVLAVATICWVVYDLYGPRSAHLREFDADEVARYPGLKVLVIRKAGNDSPSGVSILMASIFL